MPEFDVVVLGGGTAGVHVAAEVASGGRSVALVEAGLVGGESPYLACLPSKTLLEAAGRGEGWENAVARRDEVTSHLDDSSAASRLTEAGVTLLRGTGQVTKPGTIEVTTYGENFGENGAAEPGGPGAGQKVELTYTDLVLSTGSEPVAPPIEGLADIAAWTSAEALSGPDLPRRLVVLGGGSAGCELAQIYAAFGSQVTLVETEDALLPAEAGFTGEILADALRRTGIDVRLGSAAVKAERLDEGQALTLADGTRIEADRVLLATGRRPRVSGLGLDKLGVDLKPGTAIPVDSTCRVLVQGGDGAASGAGGASGADGVAGAAGSDGVSGAAGSAGSGGVSAAAGSGGAGLWAAGDVTGLGTHTHTARYQAGVVAANILGQRREADYRAIPRAVYTMPSVYAVGASPQGAAEAGIELVTAGADLAGTARARVSGTDAGRVELYAHPESKLLLGAAAVGPNAPDWMGEVTVAIRAGVPLPVLADTVHAFPTFSEALEPALRELAGKLAAQPVDQGTTAASSPAADQADTGPIPMAPGDPAEAPRATVTEPREPERHGVTSNGIASNGVAANGVASTGAATSDARSAAS